MRIFLRLLRYSLILFVCGAAFAAIGIGVAYWLIAPRLPSVESLKDVRLQVPLRVYTTEAKLVATFGQKCVFELLRFRLARIGARGVACGHARR